MIRIATVIAIFCSLCFLLSTNTYAEEVTGKVVSIKVSKKSYVVYAKIKSATSGEEVFFYLSSSDADNFAYATLMAAYLNDLNVIVNYDYYEDNFDPMSGNELRDIEIQK